MNRLDSELVAEALTEAGYVPAASEAEADVILLNTCSVRRHAEERVRGNVGTLKALKAERPGLVVGILGCMAERLGGDLLAQFPHVNLVCGPGMFDGIGGLVDAARRGERPVATGFRPDDLPGHRRAGASPSAFVAVMRGCESGCAYCVVPSLRGPVRSRAPEAVEDEVRMLAAHGCREVTLLGQSVTAYGRERTPPVSLAGLLQRLDAIPGLARIRFVTSHPRDVTDALLAAVRDLPRVCEHLHVPAQSGSDRILAAMRRGYDAAFYRAMVARARAAVPSMAFASDFIVGFPGESEEDFAATERLVWDLGFQNAFVFKYSPREGTPAAALADDVPLEVKKARNQRLLAAQRDARLARNRDLVGTVQEVLVEGPSKRNRAVLSGRTRANAIVLFGGSAAAGDLLDVRVTGCTDLTLSGTVVQGEGQ